MADNVSRREARAAAKRQRTQRHQAISAVSTVVVFVLLGSIIVRSPGWHSVREAFLSWEDFRASFPSILSGFWLDVRMFVAIEALVLIFGLMIALLRLSRSPALAPIRIAAALFVDLFRGVPTVLVIFAIGFGLPALQLSWIPSDAVLLGCAALTLSYSAYVAEVYRAGIVSVHPSQRAAARALGLTHSQTMRFVVLPQAVRRVGPALLNDFISLQKDVALVSILGPLEAFRNAQIYAAEKFNYTPLLGAALLYLCVTIPLSRWAERLESRRARRQGALGAL